MAGRLFWKRKTTGYGRSQSMNCVIPYIFGKKWTACRNLRAGFQRKLRMPSISLCLQRICHANFVGVSRGWGVWDMFGQWHSQPGTVAGSRVKPKAWLHLLFTGQESRKAEPRFVISRSLMGLYGVPIHL